MVSTYRYCHEIDNKKYIGAFPQSSLLKTLGPAMAAQAREGSWSDNLLKLEIYYEQMYTEVIVESPTYPVRVAPRHLFGFGK